MTTNVTRESATIYQFPVGGRSGLARKREEANASAYLSSLGACEASSGSGWYHEEAMRAERGRKN